MGERATVRVVVRKMGGRFIEDGEDITDSCGVRIYLSPEKRRERILEVTWDDDGRVAIRSPTGVIRLEPVASNTVEIAEAR